MAIIEGRPATDFSDMNRKYIRDVAEEIAGSSGGGLPEITESDEGKVLTVENGEAAWAVPSAVLVVTLTQSYDEEYEQNVTRANKTWQEIYNALNAGIPVFCMQYWQESENEYLYVQMTIAYASKYYATDDDFGYKINYYSHDDYGQFNNYYLYSSTPTGELTSIDPYD